MAEPGGSPSAARPRWSTLALVAVALLGVLHAASFLAYGPLDDDYIIYRYARNLVEGHGLVYNVGERFEGFVVPLWVLAIAAGLALGFDAPRVSEALSLASVFVAVLCIGLVWRRQRPRARVFAPALLLAATPPFAYHAVVGLGTAPTAALLALWLALYDRALARGARAGGAAAAMGAALLLRPESVLWGLPFAVAEWRKRRSWIGALSLLPWVGWTLFRRAYYGRWLPIPYHAKKLPLLADLEFGLRYLADATLSTGIGLLVLAGLAWFAGARGRRPLALAVAALGLFAHLLYVVYVGGDFMLLGRFFAPALPIAWVLACLGASWVLAERPRARVALAAAALLALQWTQWRRPLLLRQHRQSEVRWEAVGRALARAAPPGTRVALAPIGAIGYRSGLHVVDMLGLTHDAFLDVAPDLAVPMKSHQRYDGAWVHAQRPELVILANAWLAEGPDGRPALVISRWEQDLWAHPGFQRDYEPMELAIPGSYPLWVHVRRDATPPQGARPF